MRRLTPLLLAGLLLTGCAATAPTPDPVESTPAAPERTEVDWSQYPDDYQQIADEETEQQDCDALQDMFDVAPDDPALLSYLDEALTIAGCYTD